MDRAADDALAAIVDAGARALLREPWRAARIIPGADNLTVEELAAAMARKSRAGPPADFNAAIALAQLAVALKSWQFRAVWTDWRAAASNEPEAKAAALCEPPLRPYAARRQ